MATWLIAILMGMATWDGCNRHYQKVSDLAFSPDGKHLAVVHNSARWENVDLHSYVADVSRTISILDATSGRTERIVERVKREGAAGSGRGLYTYLQKIVAFGPEGRILLVQGFDEGDEGAVKTYDLGSGQRKGRSEKFADNRRFFFAMTPDGTYGAVSTFHGLTSWDVVVGQVKVIITNTLWEGPELGGPPFVAISANGSLIAVVTNSAVELRKASDGSLVGSVGTLASDEIIGTMAMSPDGRYAAVGSGGVTLYDVERHQSRRVNVDTNEIVTKIAFSPDGKTVAANDGYCATLFDAAAGRKVQQLQCSGWVTTLAYSPDGAALATGDTTGRVSLWNPITGRLIWSVTAPGAPAGSWVYFAAALAVWAIVCYLIWKKRQKAASASLPSA
jgi:WD40 repeat protein